MVNLTKDKFERLLDETHGVENYLSTFIYKGVVYKKKDFEIKVKYGSFWHYLSWVFSKVKIEARPVETLYDRPKVFKVLSAE